MQPRCLSVALALVAVACSGADPILPDVDASPADDLVVARVPGFVDEITEALFDGQTSPATLARTAIAVAASAALHLARKIVTALGEPAADLLARALAELVPISGSAAAAPGAGSDLDLAAAAAATADTLSRLPAPSLDDVVAAAAALPSGPAVAAALRAV